MRKETMERVLALVDGVDDAEPEEEASFAASGLVFAAASMKRHDYSRETFLERCGQAWDSLAARQRGRTTMTSATDAEASERTEP